MRTSLTFHGPLMVSLMASIAIFAIVSSAAFQAWEDVVRRDNEKEMMVRATEIARALLRFQKDQGRLPNKLDELMEPGTRGQYFLRHLYDDPLVPDGKWGLLFAAPGGGVFDPNSPNAEAAQQIGAVTDTPLDPTALQTPGAGPRTAEGLPIAGVRTLSTERPFRVHKGMRDYAQWTFTIYDVDPQQGQQQPGANPADRPGQPGSPTGGQPGGN